MMVILIGILQKVLHWKVESRVLLLRFGLKAQESI